MRRQRSPRLITGRTVKGWGTIVIIMLGIAVSIKAYVGTDRYYDAVAPALRQAEYEQSRVETDNMRERGEIFNSFLRTVVNVSATLFVVVVVASLVMWFRRQSEQERRSVNGVFALQQANGREAPRSIVGQMPRCFLRFRSFDVHE